MRQGRLAAPILIGAARCEDEICDGVERARSFYLSCGYDEEARVRDYYRASSAREC